MYKITKKKGCPSGIIDAKIGLVTCIGDNFVLCVIPSVMLIYPTLQERT